MRASASRVGDGATISSCLVLPLIGYLESNGHALAPALAAAGLCREDLASRGARIPHERAMRLWEHAVDTTRDRLLGLHVAQHVEPGIMDLIEYLARCSSTLGESLERTSTYFTLLHDEVAFEVERHGPHAILRNVVPPGLATTPSYVENALASTIVMARRMTRQEIPVDAVYFRHEAPAHTDEYDALFGGPVIFRAPVDALVIPVSCLEVDLTQADSALASILERHVKLLVADGPAGTTLRARAARLLGPELVDGVPRAEVVARRLHMSARTLRRLLRQEGCSFREVVSEVQRGRAFRYLRDPDVTLGEVSFLIGFSDPNTFHRAFKRWTGLTPGEFRAGAVQERAGAG
jgi:AraC-like DNA-binding protein